MEVDDTVTKKIISHNLLQMSGFYKNGDIERHKLIQNRKIGRSIDFGLIAYLNVKVDINCVRYGLGQYID